MTRLLVIGGSSTRDALARAAPQCELLPADSPLDGVWRSGREPFDGVYVSMSVGAKFLPAVRGVRKAAPKTRIVVGCVAADEPLARRALTEGADEYVIEPLQTLDIERAFKLVSHKPPPNHEPPAAGPSVQEILELSEVLRNLGDGPQRTLERLAKLLQQAFGATGVALQLDDLACGAGDTTQPVIEEIIRRQGKPVGRVALARHRQGAYATSAATRLAEYARLIEATLSQAHERARWQELAWTDDLSGLRNRRYFEKSLDELIADASERHVTLSLFLLDIDDFKTYNDRYGHETGDELIREVAQLLTGCTRKHDIVARYGGDEFAVLFWDAEKPRVPGSSHPREVLALTERFRKSIHEHDFPVLGPHSPGTVTVSGGVATFPWDGTTREEFLRSADEALLSAKRTGKNTIGLASGATENGFGE